MSSTTHKHRNFKYAYLLPCFFIFSSFLFFTSQYFSTDHQKGLIHQQNRRLLELVSEEGEISCIQSGIYSFPGDFFTQEQRQKGGVIIHVIITLYVCAMIAKVCDVYFIPSLEIVSDKLKLPPDVAGATFMAIGASSPELFSSILGSFVTEGDIGVGAVIGSAVFNILGITGVAGIYLWNDVLDVDWYPIARDCIAYGITVICLTWVISDSKVIWWEAAILLGFFVLYITLMYFNGNVEKCSKRLAQERTCCCCWNTHEKSPLLSKRPSLSGSKSAIKSEIEAYKTTHIDITDVKRQVLETEKNAVETHNEKSVELEEVEGLCSPPRTACSFIWWLFMLPASALLYLTVPNPANHKFQKLYPVTFMLSVAWLGVLSYLAVWMVTIIGYTLQIPDSVSGLTLLAVGASVPDLVSSVIVAKSGEGNMAISNLVGSNTFDISICLGVPWLAKALLSEYGYVRIQSFALAYATAALFITLLIFYLIFKFSKWRLNFTVGWICLLVYSAFVLLACLFEFNVFGDINLPTCYP